MNAEYIAVVTRNLRIQIASHSEPILYFHDTFKETEISKSIHAEEISFHHTNKPAHISKFRYLTLRINTLPASRPQQPLTTDFASFSLTLLSSLLPFFSTQLATKKSFLGVKEVVAVYYLGR